MTTADGFYDNTIAVNAEKYQTIVLKARLPLQNQQTPVSLTRICPRMRINGLRR
jgi:hypothetical protein